MPGIFLYSAVVWRIRRMTGIYTWSYYTILFFVKEILPKETGTEVLVTGLYIGPDLFTGIHLAGHFTGDPIFGDIRKPGWIPV